jgi:hypothetical protein
MRFIQRNRHASHHEGSFCHCWRIWWNVAGLEPAASRRKTMCSPAELHIPNNCAGLSAALTTDFQDCQL